MPETLWEDNEWPLSGCREAIRTAVVPVAGLTRKRDRLFKFAH
jgi:hypothetical protein